MDRNRRVAYTQAAQVAGLLTTETTAWDVSVIWNRLLNDPVVSARCEALGYEVDPATGQETAEMKYDCTDVVEILKAMTVQERADLRVRLLGAHGSGRSN